MSIFGESNEEFSLTAGGDEGAPKPPRKRPATPPARNNSGSNGNATNDNNNPTRRMPARAPSTRRPATPPHHTPASNLPSRKPPVRPQPAQPKVQPPVQPPTQSAPVYHEPEPVYQEPTPVYSEPEPVYSEPEPVYSEPEPVVEPVVAPIAEEKRSTGIPAMPSVSPPVVTNPEPARVESLPTPDRSYENTTPKATYESYPDETYKNVIPNQRNAFGDDDLRPARQTADMSKLPESISKYDESDFDDNSYMEENLKARLRNKPKLRSEEGEGETSSSKRGSSTKTAKSGLFSKKDAKPSSKKGKDKEGKPVSPFFGDRKRVLTTNIIAGTIILSMVGLTANSIFNKPYIPTPDDMSGLINKVLSITAFDIEGGKPIVSSFVKEYFNQYSDQSKKSETLALYTTEAVASEISATTTVMDGVKQSLSTEPQILNVKSIDDHNAVYTVGAKVGSKWVYLTVPVFYNETTKSYAISGVPAFVPPPSIAEIGAEVETAESGVEPDPEVTALTEENVRSFLKAWASSDAEGLSRYITNEATRETRLGLHNTMYLSSVDTYEASYVPAGTPDEENLRTAKVTVTWGNSAKNPSIKYSQNFQLKLYKQPDGKWYITDITDANATYTTDVATEDGTTTNTTPSEQDTSE